MPKQLPPFRGYHILTPDQVLQLKEASHNLFTAKKKARGGRYSTGDTFFIGSSETPKSIAEAYALYVFKWFTRGMSYDPSDAGAEYWPLVLDGDYDEVGAHYDKDYGAESEGRDLYPLLGTVTYLADHGAPTTFFEMVESTSREITQNPCSISRGWLSKVQSGKIVAFDGRYLHCASSSLVNMWGNKQKQSGPRVTLLVNIWFNRPRDAVRSPFVDENFTEIQLPPTLPDEAFIPTLDMHDGTEIHIELGGTKLCMNCTVDILSIVKSNASCVELLWPDGKCCIHNSKFKEKQERKEKKGKKRNKRR